MAWYLLKRGEPFANYSNHKEFMIDTAEDIETPPSEPYAPGSTAHTPGYKEVYEAAADGSWVQINAPVEDGSDD